MSKTINRIIELISEMGMSARQFDISIGTANGYILRMEKNNASVGSDVIERIAKQYPRVNLVWLITGEGEMYKPEVDYIERISDAEIDKRLNATIKRKNQQKKKGLLKDIDKELGDI